jgi:CheY-like chemotaxis protein
MRCKVLVIEDNIEMGEIIAELLTLEGFQVDLAESGSQAFTLLKKTMPDMIICDINMPGMDGFEVLTKLRAYQVTQFIPFMFMTTKAESAEIQKAKDFGISNYLIKPFHGQELLNAINLLIQGTAE